MSAIPPLSGETTLVNEARVYTYEDAAIVTPNSDTPSKRTGTDPTKRPPQQIRQTAQPNRRPSQVRKSVAHGAPPAVPELVRSPPIKLAIGNLKGAACRDR